jgi:hypothetical protein
VRTYLDAVDAADLGAVADRSYIACTDPGLPVLEASRARVRAAGWRFAELAAGHDAMVTHPREVARAIAA